MTGRPVRVVLADDHPIFRDGLRTALAGIQEIEIVGEAENGNDVIGLVADTKPDVVLMDLHMPGGGGIEATRQLNAAGGPAVLVLTMHEDDESLFAAIRVGARGYLLKGANRAEVVTAVLGVADGGAVFGPGIARRVLALCSTGAPRPGPGAPFPSLTERERDVLDLLAQGLGNHNIAAQLALSPKTVRNHVSSILGKLHTPTRGEAIIKAHEEGFGPRPRSSRRPGDSAG